MSAAEVTGISAIGLRLLAADCEYFVPFADYPDFRRATVEQLYRLENPSPTQVYWPDSEVPFADIEVPLVDSEVPLVDSEVPFADI